MYQKSTIVVCRGGLGSEAATEFVQLASRFCSELFIEISGKKINAKSIIGIVSAGISDRANILISGNGSDSTKAVETLCKFVSEELRYLDL